MRQLDQVGQAYSDIYVRIACISVLLILSGLLVQSISATTIRVPVDQPTIQAGVDAASESDTVLVAPGTYTGAGNYDILLDGKGLVVRSESGPAVTIIDCEGNGRGFTLQGPMAVDPVIEGFTIKNGNSEYGGGVECHGVSVIIRRCVFIGNTANLGGAIYSDEYVDGTWHDAVMNVVNCTFVNNHADDRGSVSFSASSMTVVVNQSTMSANTCNRRGPVDMGFSYPYVQLYCCNIYGNSPGDWIGGISSWYGVEGNTSVHPMFCDVDNGLYGIHAESPMGSAASPCGELVGAIGVSCSDCYDIDNDGWCAAEDNCPVHANADQLDSDANGTGDVCENDDGDTFVNAEDNCPAIANEDQSDHDSDGIGDVCDSDIDGDGYANESDNCPVNYNPGQEGEDYGGRGDACCCVGLTGNANGSTDDRVTIGDLAAMVNALFIAGTCEGVIGCLAEADINQSGGCNPTCDDLTIGDISSLVTCMFVLICDPWNTPPCLECP